MTDKTVAYAVQKKGLKAGFVSHDRVMTCQRDGVSVLCVADGLGSCALSHVGAYFAVRYFSGDKVQSFLCGSQDPEKDFLECVGLYKHMMHSIAARWGRPVGDFSTTLTLVLAMQKGVYGFRVGDGFAVGRSHKEYFSLFDYSSAAQDVTQTLLSSGVHCSFFCSDKPLSFVMVSSDGLLHLTYDVKSGLPYQSFFIDLEKELLNKRKKNSYLRKVLRAAGHQDPLDDKSIAVFLR